jgi:hypothetical protein
MSRVTNIIVSLDYMRSNAAIDMVNQWLLDRQYPPLDRIDSDSGGNKNLEVELFVGAFNHFDLTGYGQYLKTLDIGDATLMVQEQDDTHFRVLEIHELNT